jgi:hypothetical protein
MATMCTSVIYTPNGWSSYTSASKPEQSILLRILLLHQKGCATWNDIKTVDGVTHPTFKMFKAACIALDLNESDQMWIESMDEAYAAQLPSTCWQ